MSASSGHPRYPFVSAALAASNVGTWDYDVEGNRLVGDETIAALFGLSIEDAERGVPMERIGAVVHPDDLMLGRATLRRMMERGGPFMMEYRTLPAPNVMRRVMACGRCDIDENGHVWHGSGIAMDVTDMERRAETEPGPKPSMNGIAASVESERLENRLLRSLSADSFAALRPSLERVDLPKGFVISKPNEVIDSVYFPDSGLCSVIAVSSGGNQAETGVYGRDGFGPVTGLFGATRSPQRVMVQISGSGHRIASHQFMELTGRVPALRALLTLYAQTAMVQTAFTAMSNAIHTIETRLARWLLMCHDRSTSDDLPLTHDFLALMLAVRRPGVTVALHMLEGERMIRSGRGLVTIRDRAGLERFAADSYGTPEAEYRRLIGEFGTRKPGMSL